MHGLPENLEKKLINLGKRLLDQQKAKVAVSANGESQGFWFGGGNIVKDPKTGNIYVCGRYRNSGDSRYGVGMGERGAELAIFKADNVNGSFEKVKSWSKKDLTCGGKEVISIEGSSIVFHYDKVELFISTEKNISYPEGFEQFQKPGTGVWDIDVLEGGSIEDLSVKSIKNVLSSEQPESLHVKDPAAFINGSGDTCLLYCKHPFSWSSSYTGGAVRKKGTEEFEIVSEDVLPRGYVWDVAVSRVTGRLSVPRVGKFKDIAPISLYFYDGAECLRELPQSDKGVRRPRGYSCEELGGLAYGFDDEFPIMYRLSEYFPLFVSPDGTGCSRYASILSDNDGLAAVWQKSMPDFSQPLVINTLSRKEFEEILK